MSEAQGEARSAATDDDAGDGGLRAQPSTASRSRQPLPFDEQSLLQAGRVLEHLRSQLAEIERREQNLNSQLTALEHEQRVFRMRVRAFEERADEQLTEQREIEEKLKQRAAVLEQRLQEADQRSQELTREQAEFRLEQARLRDELNAELAGQRQQLAQEVEGLAAARLAHQEMVRQFEQEQTARQRELDDREQRAAAEHEQRRDSLERERIDLEKRTRLHEEHLQRFRQELEAQRADLERDRQCQRVWKEQVEESLRLRIAHVRRYRDLLEQRELSLVRAEEALRSGRRQAEKELVAARERLAGEREAFEQQQQRDRSDLRRQQDLLQSHSRTLDQRRSKLDVLRDELERTHRETLEERMILEQARAVLVDEAGQEEAGHRVEQARKSLLDFHRQLRESADLQRHDLAEQLRTLQEKRIAFREEREALRDWHRERESDLERRETRLQQQLVGVHEREHRWQQLRERWRREKVQAEDILRGLVIQLEVALESREPPPATSDGPDRMTLAAVAAA